jgi:hypothetical protein
VTKDLELFLLAVFSVLGEYAKNVQQWLENGDTRGLLFQPIETRYILALKNKFFPVAATHRHKGKYEKSLITFLDEIVVA